MSPIAKIQRHYQVTLPAAVRRRAKLSIGDLVDFEVREEGILIRPLETIDRSQAWFWSKRWQEEEQKVEADFKKGRVKVSKDIKSLFAELDE
jgi:AbrB family looped-hinge helix DNA binding protein